MGLTNRETLWSSVFALAALASLVLFADPDALWQGAILALGLSIIAAVDIERWLIPDVLTGPLTVLGLLVALLAGPERALHAVIGCIGGFGALWLVRWVFKRATGRDGLGLGDAKLFAVTGAWLAWPGLAPSLALACMLGLAVAGLRFLRYRSAEGAVAFGPYLAAGTWVMWLVDPFAALQSI